MKDLVVHVRLGDPGLIKFKTKESEIVINKEKTVAKEDKKLLRIAALDKD